MNQSPKRIPRSLALLFGVTLLGLGATACDKGKAEGGDKATAKGAEAGAAAAGAEAGAAAPDKSVLDAPAVIDEEIMADLKAIVANCEVKPDGCNVNNCKNKEKDTLLDRFKKKDGKVEKDRGEAIDSFAAALADPDPMMQTAAVSVLYSGYRAMPDAKPVAPAAAMRMINAWSKLPKYQANQSSAAVVHASMLSANADVREALYKAVAAHPEASKGSAYEDFLTYGRLDALPKLQEIAKGDDEDSVVGALASWRNMYEPSAEEKAKVCPWIAEYLGDARVDVFEAAGNGANKCGGEYVAKVLDEGEKRLSEKHEFTRKHYFVFRELCHDFLKGEDTGGREAECERNYAFLQKVVDDEAVDSEMRSLALDAIYYQRRDAKSKALAQTYVGHKDEKISERAKEIVEKLEDK